MSDCVICDMNRRLKHEQELCDELDNSDECCIVTEYEEDEDT